MYARDYNTQKSGAVRAFEDAYAKEDFLRRAAENPPNHSCTGVQDSGERAMLRLTPQDQEPPGTDALTVSEAPKTVEKAKKLPFGLEKGDMLLVFLILFFLSDGDKENDSLVPILLAVLLLV